MTKISKRSSIHRRRLLAGAGIALAATLAAASANAQIATVQTQGNHVLANQQTAPLGTSQASGNGDSETIVTGSITGATTVSSANLKTVRAASNQADLSLAPDPGIDDTPYGQTALIVGTDGVSAKGGTVIASRQDMGTAIVRATTAGTSFGLEGGAVANSTIAITDNSVDASAAGNGATADLALAGGAIGDGAGVTSMQTQAASTVLAGARDQVGLALGPVTASTLAIRDNLVRAIASGNTASDSLSAVTTSLVAPTAPGYASAVIFDDAGDAVVTGALGILGDQVAGGTVKAVAGGSSGSTFRTVTDGTVDRSVLATDGNMLDAAGYGNQSANALDVAASSIAGTSAGDGRTPGAVATVTGLQRIDDGTTINANATGGVATDIAGDLSASTVSVSDNTERAIAAGNAASGNALTVSAGTVDAPGDGWGTDPKGSVLVGSGGARADAAFSVQTIQDYGSAAIGAARTGAGAAATVAGGISGSVVYADGNIEQVGATGNGATSTLGLDAAALHSTAAINNLQSGDGNVTAALGTADARGGSTIASTGPVDNAQLTVASNMATGTAIADNAVNSLTVTAGAIADGTKEAGASGAMPGSTQGAAGTFAVANNQKLAEPSFGGTLTPTISSSVFGVYGITSAGAVRTSSISVDDNQQRADALGNTAVNRLTVSGAPQEGGSSAPATASFSAQDGRAEVSATSDAMFTVPGDMASSATSLSRNTNLALAVINDADSAVSVTGLGRSTAREGALASGETSVPQAVADVAMTNQQFASGSADAAATTQIGAGVAGALDASRLTIADNLTTAEAAGNRALNAGTAGATTGAPTMALASRQESIARVSAESSADGDAVQGTPAWNGADIAITGNSVSALARGNAVDNELTNEGAGTSGPAGASILLPVASTAADAALFSTQANFGVVSATASYGEPLNGRGAAQGSTLAETGNAVAATAYGNSATNMITASTLGRAPSTSIVNLQANYSAVSAQVTGPAGRAFGPMSAGSFSITGNQLSAVAAGNQASNSIATPR